MHVWITILIGGAVLVAVAVAPGLYLWWPTRRRKAARSDLGVNLMTGALVAFAILLLQVVVERQLTNIEDRRQAQSARQGLLLQLGLKKDLTSFDLSDKDLTRAYLYNKTLNGAIFRRATLKRANLSRSNLYLADFEEARLNNANLSGTTSEPPRGESLLWPTVDFKGAHLEGNRTNLTGVNFDHAAFDGAHLEDAQLDGAILPGASFTGADLRNVSVSGANVGGADLSGADLRGTDLSGVADFGVKNVDHAVYDSKTLWPAKWPSALGPRPRDCPAARVCVVCRAKGKSVVVILEGKPDNPAATCRERSAG